MMLMSPTSAALAIGAKCGGAAPTPDDASLIEVLNLLTPRVEAALECISLTLAQHDEVFIVTKCQETLSETLLLRAENGFIIPDTVAITDEDGTVLVKETDFVYTPENGVIRLKTWIVGEYAVSYLSGFEPEVLETDDPSVDPETNDRVLQGVPDWIKGIVVDVLVLWYRSQALSPKLPKEVNFRELLEPLFRDIRTRVYGRYMRPRANVVFAERR